MLEEKRGTWKTSGVMGIREMVLQKRGEKAWKKSWGEGNTGDDAGSGRECAGREGGGTWKTNGVMGVREMVLERRMGWGLEVELVVMGIQETVLEVVEKVLEEMENSLEEE